MRKLIATLTGLLTVLVGLTVLIGTAPTAGASPAAATNVAANANLVGVGRFCRGLHEQVTKCVQLEIDKSSNVMRVNAWITDVYGGAYNVSVSQVSFQTRSGNTWRTSTTNADTSDHYNSDRDGAVTSWRRCSHNGTFTARGRVYAKVEGRAGEWIETPAVTVSCSGRPTNGPKDRYTFMSYTGHGTKVFRQVGIEIVHETGSFRASGFTLVKASGWSAAFNHLRLQVYGSNGWKTLTESADLDGYHPRAGSASKEDNARTGTFHCSRSGVIHIRAQAHIQTNLGSPEWLTGRTLTLACLRG